MPLLRRNATRLILIAFVVVPIAIALIPRALGSPAAVSPSLLIACGVGFFALTIRLVKDLTKYESEDTEPGHELGSIAGDRMLSDKPYAVWAPFLFTASWMLILIGLLWLAVVDWESSLVATALLVVAYVIWWLRLPKRRRPSPPGTTDD